MKIRAAVLGILIVGVVMTAGAQRRPAVVEAIEAQRDQSIIAHRLDAERFWALKRVALLRGALKRLRHDMSAAEPNLWDGNVPPTGSIYRDVYDAAGAALEADDRLAGAR